MSALIEDYGLIGNMRGSALVSKEGSVDWLCLPRFDSDAVFAALLGRDEHGCWRIQPTTRVKHTSRRYRTGSVILETDFECESGAIRLIDFMPVGGRDSVIRIVEGLRGQVSLWFTLSARFGYGKNQPWISKADGGLRMTVAPDSLMLRTKVALGYDERDVRGEFTVKQGQRLSFELTWGDAHRPPPPPLDCEAELKRTDAWWTAWSKRSTYKGAYEDAVNSSLVVLKAMTYEPTGAIVAAPTASLPEALGGERNWDYRYCWLRDASLTVLAFLAGGYTEEADQLRGWMIRAAAGNPDDLQIMYGLSGEKRLSEFELPWMPGYADSRPVHIGNAAHGQFQLDTFGETLGTIYAARRCGLKADETGAGIIVASRMLDHLMRVWQEPDDGIWEVRGGRRHFVHSKLMAWVAVDRFIKQLEEFPPDRPQLLQRLPEFKALRERIHREVCDRGFNKSLGCFTQAYDSTALDSAVLLMPLVGFLPADDARVQGTIRMTEKTLMRDGFLLRYSTAETNDGLKGEEGAFLPCTFWLAAAHAMSGRMQEADRIYKRLLGLRNDLGLISEEFDFKSHRLIGNFPQAYSHLALVNCAPVVGSGTVEVGPTAAIAGR